MLSEFLRNRVARKATWLDGVGAPTVSEVGKKDVTRIRPVDEGVLIAEDVLDEENEPAILTSLIPWGQVLRVDYDGAVP